MEAAALTRSTLIPKPPAPGFFGTAELQKDGKWSVAAQPHVRIKLRAVFQSAKGVADTLLFHHTEAFAEEFEWFLQRYPLEVPPAHFELLKQCATGFRERKQMAMNILHSGALSLTQQVPLTLPMRPYQAQAVALNRNLGGLLLADAIGLGKTVSAIGLVNEEGACPAMVVCPVNLMDQWKEQFAKFAPHLNVHKIKIGKYTLPEHHVLLIPYTRLVNWRDRLANYNTVIFEEAHELRHSDSAKYEAAVAVRSRAKWAMALTGTPVYNYGIEAFNIIDILMPGALGNRYEFAREWCSWAGKKVNDPVALGSYLREQHLILRRTREEVGRELPPVNTVTHTIDFDASILDGFQDEALQLARKVLSEGIAFADKGQAARDLSMKLYELTGIAKSVHAANFVADMVENGECLIVYAWHRKVWDVFQHIFKQRKIKFAMYTGTESPKKKEEAKAAFINGDVDVLCMSIRSGVGIDGLQTRANLCVFAELHWSPQQLSQDIGRLARDEQKESVTAVYLVADGGCDPDMANLIGLKRDQNSGITDMTLARDGDDSLNQVQEARGVLLAKSVLARYGGSLSSAA